MPPAGQITRRELQEAAAMRRRLQASLGAQLRRLERLDPPASMRSELAAETAALAAALEVLIAREQQQRREEQSRAEGAEARW